MVWTEDVEAQWPQKSVSTEEGEVVWTDEGDVVWAVEGEAQWS